MYATGKGEIVSEEMILVDVWYVKGISESLISINQLANRGAIIKIELGKTVITNKYGYTIVVEREKRSTLSYIELTCKVAERACVARTRNSEWAHRLLGHPGVKQEKEFCLRNNIKISEERERVCDICERARGKSIPYKQ